MYLKSYFEMLWTYVASVGWYIVGLLGIVWYTYPYIQDKYTKWKKQRDEQEYDAKYHKNVDLRQQRLSELEASRQKMQEKYEKATQIAKEKEEEQKRKKQEEVSKLLNGSHRLGGDRNNDPSASGGPKSKSLKPEYNPLMGDGSRRYRPPKRSCCGKGGCG